MDKVHNDMIKYTSDQRHHSALQAALNWYKHILLAIIVFVNYNFVIFMVFIKIFF